MKLFQTLVAYAAVLMCGYIALQQHILAYEATSLYEQTREQLQAYVRTQGRGIDSAYVCRRKR